MGCKVPRALRVGALRVSLTRHVPYTQEYKLSRADLDDGVVDATSSVSALDVVEQYTQEYICHLLLRES